MRGLICVLSCVAALVSHSEAQVFPGMGPGFPGVGPGNPGQGNPAFPGNPGSPVNPAGPANPGGPAAPAVPLACPRFWILEKGSCYRFHSGAISTAPTPNGPVFVNPTDGKTQAAANMECQLMQSGSSLVTVNNKAENDFLFEWVVNMMAQPEPVWTGLHLGPMGTPQWYSGEIVAYTNWEMGQVPRGGEGATLFDVDIQNAAVNNQIEITTQWKPEEVITERPFICECKPNPVLEAPTVATTTMQTATRPMPPTTPRPVMLNHGPMNIQSGGNFGGSRLFEVRRNQRNRPLNYRKNPFYGVMP